MSTLKVQLEDTDGNIYYMKTDANSVYCEDGFTVQHYLNNVILKDKIINNTSTADSTKVASAYVANNLQKQIDSHIKDFSNMLNPIYRGAISTWSSASQINKGAGIYYIGEISNDYWNQINTSGQSVQNTGDFVLYMIQYNGASTAGYGTGFMVTPRLSTPLFVKVWDSNYYIYKYEYQMIHTDSAVDFNSLIDPGIYTNNVCWTSISNAPSEAANRGSIYGFLRVTKYNSGSGGVCQELYDIWTGIPVMYIRRRWGESWGPWFKFSGTQV